MRMMQILAVKNYRLYSIVMINIHVNCHVNKLYIHACTTYRIVHVYVQLIEST